MVVVATPEYQPWPFAPMAVIRHKMGKYVAPRLTAGLADALRRPDRLAETVKAYRRADGRSARRCQPSSSGNVVYARRPA